jgi:hypothetical protein
MNKGLVYKYEYGISKSNSNNIIGISYNNGSPSAGKHRNIDSTKISVKLPLMVGINNTKNSYKAMNRRIESTSMNNDPSSKSIPVSMSSHQEKSTQKQV